MFKEFLESDQEQDYHVGGDFVYITSGDSVRIVTSVGHHYSLSTGQQIQTDAFRSIQITNLSESRDLVQIKTGFGIFHPAGEGNSVSIVGGTEINDPIEIAPSQSVAVRPRLKNIHFFNDVIIGAGERVRLVAAFVERTKLIVQASCVSSSPQLLRIAETNVASNLGFKLFCSADLTVYAEMVSHEEIWAFNTGDVNIIVNCVSESEAHI